MMDVAIFLQHGRSHGCSICTDPNLGRSVGEAPSKHLRLIAARIAPCQEERRDAEAVEAAGQEVDHGRLAIAAPGEVANADDGHGQGAARAEPREEQ